MVYIPHWRKNALIGKRLSRSRFSERFSIWIFILILILSYPGREHSLSWIHLIWRSQKMIRTNLWIHKDETKSLYIQTFIFVLMNLYLSISVLYCLLDVVAPIQFRLEVTIRSFKYCLYYLVAQVWIKKYQDIQSCSLCLRYKGISGAQLSTNQLLVA